jgi:hypothetical protein
LFAKYNDKAIGKNQIKISIYKFLADTTIHGLSKKIKAIMHAVKSEKSLFIEKNINATTVDMSKAVIE